MRGKAIYTDHRIHTRKIDRGVAKNNMKILGVNLHNCIKHHMFGSQWREYSRDVKVGGRK